MAVDELLTDSGSRRPFQRAGHRAALVHRDSATLVAFTIGDDTLAAPVECVERVLRYVTPSPIPALPAWLEGVVQHHGHMVPVIDLRKRLQRPAPIPDATTRIIVFNTQPEWLAAIVDAVPEVLVVEASSIVAPPALVRGLSGEYLRGLVTHRDTVVLVLDVAKLLTSSDTLSLHDVTTMAS